MYICVLGTISLPHSLATLNQHPMNPSYLTLLVVAIPVDQVYCKLRPGFEGSQACDKKAIRDHLVCIVDTAATATAAATAGLSPGTKKLGLCQEKKVW